MLRKVGFGRAPLAVRRGGAKRLEQASVDLGRADAPTLAAMTSLPRALALSVGQLGDPAILKVLAKTAAITLAVFALLGWGASFGFAALLEWAGIDDGGGMGTLLAILLAVTLGWLLFRIVALAVLQFFADEIVRAVEVRHYPQAATSARKIPLREELGNSLRSTARALLVNLAVLPIALLLLFTGVGTALLFWLVNAGLLGRELTDMAWLPHRRDPAETPPFGAAMRFLLGGVVAALLAIPFVNLLAPVIGAASAAHLVHGARRSSNDA